MFEKIQGQSHALQILRSAIANNRVAQAYLFHGPAGVGKFTTALYFGMALNCQAESEVRPCGVCSACQKLLNMDHPDYIHLFPTPNFKMSPEGEIKDSANLQAYLGYIQNKIESPWKEYRFNKAVELRLDNIRMLIHSLNLSITELNMRICIIEDVDMMNTATANAFLKTLEEPPPRTIMLLTSCRLPKIIPTIISRCQTIYFKPLARSTIQQILRDKHGFDLLPARTAARIANGNFKAAFRIAEDSTLSLRELAFEIFSLAKEANELKYLQLLDRTRENINAESTRLIFDYLGFIANDMIMLNSNPDAVTNIDKVELLRSIQPSKMYLEDEVYSYLMHLEDFKNKIEGNVNLRLLLLNNFYALEELLKG